MKAHIFNILFAIIVTACTQNNGSDHSKISSDQRIRNQAIEFASKYVNTRLSTSKKTVSNDGLITFSSGDTKCLIDPVSILIGEIDEDSYKDAIVTVLTFRGHGLPLKEHFILINKNGKLDLSKKLQGEMKFLSVSDRIIYIETSRMAADSPFSDCQICKEIKKYKFIKGDTVRIK